MTFKVEELPTAVRVGPHDIRFSTLEGEEARKNHGTFIPADLEIRLQHSYATGSQAVDTLVHEVLHAIFAVGAIEVKQGEEHIVSVMGTYLAQILRDNPDLVKWMQQAVTK